MKQQTDHLSKKQQDKSPRKKPRQEEKLSRNDWLNIMGVHRDTYTRINGAVRRK